MINNINKLYGMTAHLPNTNLSHFSTCSTNCMPDRHTPRLWAEAVRPDQCIVVPYRTSRLRICSTTLLLQIQVSTYWKALQQSSYENVAMKAESLRFTRLDKWIRQQADGKDNQQRVLSNLLSLCIPQSTTFPAPVSPTTQIFGLNEDSNFYVQLLSYHGS